MQSRLFVVILSALTVVACGPGETNRAKDSSGLSLPAGVEIAAEVITEELLREHVTILAGDEMEGRGPGSEGDRRARRYLIEQMQRIGLQPAFDDAAWEQALTIVGVTAHMPESWQFRTERDVGLVREG